MAKAVSEITGIFGDEVFKVIGPDKFPETWDEITVTRSSNSFPSRTVLSSVWKAGLLQAGSETDTGWSSLLTILTTWVWLVCASGDRLNTAYMGLMSKARQMAPLI